MDAPEDSLFQLTPEACRAHFMNPPQGVDVVRPAPRRWRGTVVSEEVERGANATTRTWPSAADFGSCLWRGHPHVQFLKSNEEAQRELWASVDRLAFGEAWKDAVATRFGRIEEVQAREACELLWTNMEEGGKLKGLVPFHVIDNEVENAFDAHVAMWRMLFPEKAKMWFTVPVAKADEVSRHLSKVAAEVDCQLPHQNPATDLPVLSQEGTWLTDASGEVIRRPGGHGALLPLLEELDVPMVVIRNIDNAPTPGARADRAKWTKAMVAACDAWAQERVQLREELQRDACALHPVKEWLNAAGAGLDEAAELSKSEALAWLDRPMRLVGVVRNEGQPGGGPYWIRIRKGMDAGLVRPQVVESIEFEEGQKALMADATHFNPVDMVCVLRPVNPWHLLWMLLGT